MSKTNTTTTGAAATLEVNINNNNTGLKKSPAQEIQNSEKDKVAVENSNSTTTTTNGQQVQNNVVEASSKAYGRVALNLDNVIIPESKITPSLSLKDGLDPEAEIDLRILGCDLIQTSGILLRLPQTAMATGQVLFHRFYYSKSFVRKAMETTAMACIYLASKIEEAPRRIRDVINVFHHIKQYRNEKELHPLILDAAYIRLKNDVVLAERHVLKELGFCVHVKHPHKLIVTIMNFLGFDDNIRFLQMSWNYMNDALRSNVFVRYRPETIACACIYLSARFLKIPLPNSPAWYRLFEAEEKELIDICESILELYERPKVNQEELERTVDKLIKAYQESRVKAQASKAENEKSNTPTSTSSPASRPTSPNSLAAQAILAAARVKQEQMKSDKDRRGDESKGRDDDKDRGRDRRSRDRDRDLSPRSRKPRRSSSYSDDSPSSRHKHKKQKKSRSYYRSRSRSRSRSYDRKNPPKKIHRRERSRSRSRSPYRKHHHKKKSYYK